MNKKLFFQAITKYLLGLIIVFLLLFVPAESLSYWNAWLFIGLLFIPMFIFGLILMFKNPTLLKNRLNVKEKESDQKLVIILSAIMFILGFSIAGLNYKYNWTHISNTIVYISSIVFVISYILYAEVLRENTYLSRTIEVVDNQKVIDTGMYSIVRHPMYTITIILFLMIPLILGSIISFLYRFLSLVLKASNSQRLKVAISSRMRLALLVS